MIPKIIVYLPFLILLVPSLALAQATNLKGQLIDDNDIPLKNEIITFVGYGTTTTDSNGEFTYSLPDNVTDVEISLSNGLQVFYPPNSSISILKDPDQIVKIFAGKSFKDQITEKLNQLQDNYNDTTLVSKLLNNFTTRMKIETDRKIEFLKMESAESEKIRKAKEEAFNREREKKQAETISTFTIYVDHYISRTKDFRDAFEQNENRIFYDTGRNTNKVKKRIEGYSEAYEDINRNKESIIQDVKINWDMESHERETRQLLSYILDQFHRITILKYIEMLDDIEAFNKKEKGSRKKSEIRADIRKFVKELTEGIQFIEREKVRVVQILDSE